LWVADSNNTRTLRFEVAGAKPNGGFADFVLGREDFMTYGQSITQAGMTIPRGLAVDPNGNLFVCQLGNTSRVTRFSPGNPQPDNTVGKKKNIQKGNDIYNNSGAGQKITVKGKPGKSSAKVFYALQNDGPYDDLTKLRATRGGGKMDIKYFLAAPGQGRKNVTARITKGAGHRHLLLYNATARLEARIKFNQKGKKTVYLLSQSLENGATDRVKAKVKGK
jgi:hypothetical protein